MHIPKTAGSTLRRNFELNFNDRCLFLYSELIGQAPLDANNSNELRIHRKNNGDKLKQYIAQNATPDIDFLFGHKVNTELHNSVQGDREPRYITFLREPVERIISLYNFTRNSPQIPEDHEAIAQNWTLEEWLERTKRDIKNSQLMKFLPESAFPDTSQTDEQLNFQLSNYHLETAKESLSRFWFVGLTETFNSDALYLYGKLGTKRFYPEKIVNASPNKKAVSPQTRERIAAMNTLDIEFYNFACEYYSDFISKNQSDYQKQKKKALLLQSLYRNSTGIRSLLRRLHKKS